MSEEELCGYLAHDFGGSPKPVRVTGGDYVYDGWLVGGAVKRNTVVRAVVEDSTRRLFIHNASQLEWLDESIGH